MGWSLGCAFYGCFGFRWWCWCALGVGSLRLGFCSVLVFGFGGDLVGGVCCLDLVGRAVVL